MTLLFGGEESWLTLQVREAIFPFVWEKKRTETWGITHFRGLESEAKKLEREKQTKNKQYTVSHPRERLFTVSDATVSSRATKIEKARYV